MANTPDISTNPRQPEVAGPAPFAQWIGIFLAPVVFFVHLQTSYLLVMYVCGSELGNALVYAANIVAIVVAGVGCWAAWLAWSRAGGDYAGDGDGVLPRTRMMGAVGLGVSALFALLLAAQLVVALVAPTCE